MRKEIDTITVNGIDREMLFQEFELDYPVQGLKRITQLCNNGCDVYQVARIMKINDPDYAFLLILNEYYKGNIKVSLTSVLGVTIIKTLKGSEFIANPKAV